MTERWDDAAADLGLDDEAPREQSAELRISARQLRDFYLALGNEGFSEEQALALLGSVILAGA